MHQDIIKKQKIQDKIKYKFTDEKLLIQALTHRSHDANHNERLEFLGDAVLDLAVAQILFELYPKVSEGTLSRMRSQLVNEKILATLARKMELGQFIRLGFGEIKSGGADKDSILANTFEAILGAIYLDNLKDFSGIRHCITELLKEEIDCVSQECMQHTTSTKSLLQEYLQKRGLDLPKYSVVSASGYKHCLTYTVSIKTPLFKEVVYGTGSSKKVAEQDAADKILKMLQGCEQNTN